MARAQNGLYVGLSNGGLFWVDPQACNSQYIGNTGTMTDIAVCPSGEMYGIDWTQLYSIDPITGATTYLGNIGSSFNNLVCGPDNTLYAVHNGSQTLNIIDPITLEATPVANIGYSSAGDLTYYQGELYLAATGSDLVLIEDNNNTVFIGEMNASNQVYGISTLFTGNIVNCEPEQYMIAAAGNDIYSLDPLTGDVSLLCENVVPGYIWGNASMAEAQPTLLSAGNDTSVTVCPGIYNLSTFLTGASSNGAWYDATWNQLNNGTVDLTGITTGMTISYAYVIDHPGCEDTSTLSIEIIPFPVSLGNDPTLCPGGQVTLGPATSNGIPLNTGLDEYLWSTFQTTHQITVTSPGVYWAEVTRDGCTGIDSIEVFPFDEDWSIIGDSVLCTGSSITLSTSIDDADLYTWSTNNYLPSITIESEGIYWVDIMKNGCVVRDSIVITSNTIEVDLGNDVNACQNDAPIHLESNILSGSFLWSDGNTTSSIDVNSDGLYWLSVSNGSCSDTDTIEVTFDTITVDLGPDITVCKEMPSVLLESNIDDVDYLWSDGSMGANLTVSETGLYAITVSNGNCSASDSILVTFDTITVELGPDATVCKETPFVLLDGDIGPVNYLWSDGSTDPSLSVHQSGIYWLSVSDDYCSHIDSIEVTFDTITVDLGPDITVCKETPSVLLESSIDDVDYLWSDGSTNANLEVNSTGEYWISVSDGTCSHQDSIDVLFDTVLVSLGPDQTLCEEADSFVIVSDLMNATDYLWSDGSTLPDLTVFTSGTYWLSVTDNMCSHSDTINVTFETLTVDLGPDTFKCEPDHILFTEIEYDSYLWQDGSTNPYFIVTQEGEYWIEVTLDGCIARDTILVEDHSFTFLLGPDTFFCKTGDEIIVQAPIIGDAYLWQDNSTNNSFTANQEGYYNLVIEKDGCSFEDELFIEDRSFTPYFIEDTFLCQGQTILIGSNQIFDTYAWQDGSSNPSLEASQEGIYIVEVELNQCIESDTILIGDHSFSFSIGKDTSLCNAPFENILITPSITGDAYVWQDGTTTFSYVANQAGTYTLEIEKQGCSYQDTMIIEDHTFSLDLGDDVTLCSPQEFATIQSNIQVDSYLWDDNSTDPNLITNVTGYHWLQAQNGSCIESDTMYVGLLNIDLNLGNDTTLCQGENISLSSNISAEHYIWSTGSEHNSIIVDSAGIYSLVITIIECEYQDQVTINYANQPLKLEDEIIKCTEDKKVSLKSLSSGSYQSYLWNTGETTSSISTEELGLFSLQVMDEFNCKYFDQTLISYKPANVYVGEDLQLCLGESVTLSAQKGFSSYVWNTNAIDDYIVVNKEGDYTVTVIDTNGCVATDSVLIEFFSCQVYVPNTFTPNGDNVNDLFFPKYENVENTNLKIFNRWGDLIYEQEDPMYHGWDGKFRGNPVKQDVYQYIFTYKSPISHEHVEKTGKVTLIR